MVLVLNLRMGHVSPQFHVKLGDFFKMVAKDTKDPGHMETPEWQYLSGFLSMPGRRIKKGHHMLMVTPLEPSSNDSSRTGTAEQGTGEQDLHGLPPSKDTPVAVPMNKHIMLARTTQGDMETHTRSRCTTIRPTQQYTDSLAQREQGLVAWEILMDQDDSEMIPSSESQYEVQ